MIWVILDQKSWSGSPQRNTSKVSLRVVSTKMWLVSFDSMLCNSVHRLLVFHFQSTVEATVTINDICGIVELSFFSGQPIFRKQRLSITNRSRRKVVWHLRSFPVVWVWFQLSVGIYLGCYSLTEMNIGCFQSKTVGFIYTTVSQRKAQGRPR